MSWHKITLPLSSEIDPDVVHIGKLGWLAYDRANRPDGFAMFHATRASEGELDDKFLVYLSPLASELCTEVAENFKLEPCEVPARDEPNIAFVLGDFKVMADLKDEFEPEPGTIEWINWEPIRTRRAAEQAAYEAAQAEATESEPARTDSAQA